MTDEHRKADNQARFDLARLFDTAILAIDFAKCRVYTESPQRIAEALKDFKLDLETLTAALENNPDVTSALRGFYAVVNVKQDNAPPPGATVTEDGKNYLIFPEGVNEAIPSNR